MVMTATAKAASAGRPASTAICIQLLWTVIAWPVNSPAIVWKVHRPDAEDRVQECLPQGDLPEFEPDFGGLAESLLAPATGDAAADVHRREQGEHTKDAEAEHGGARGDLPPADDAGRPQRPPAARPGSG